MSNRRDAPPTRRWNGLVERASLAASLAAAAFWATSQSLFAAADSTSLEHKVKSAYLYNFAGYVEWPSSAFANPQSPIRVGIVGAEPIAAELAQIATGRTVHGRSISVQQLTHKDSLSGFHIVFIGADSASSIKDIVQAALPRSVLVVTETPHALANGSIINFVLAERRVRFEIALDTADKSNLKLSSRLLSVAQHVRTGAP